MATKHLGLVIYGCVVVAILRSQGVASAPVQGEAANVQANKIADLEQQLMQQSGENKSSQPDVSSVNQGDPADPQNAPADDALADDVEATGLSSDYYGLPSSEVPSEVDKLIDDATQPERLNNQLEENSNEDNPAAGAEEEEEDANSDGKLLDEQVYNGRDHKGYGINFEERSYADDAQKIENEENKRQIRNEDDIEQIERPWEEVSDFESEEAPPSGVASEKENANEGDAQEKAKEEEKKEQPKADEEDEQKIRDDRKNLEQQRYIEDGQDNTAKTFDSHLLLSREKKTLQGKWHAAELDKSERHKDGERLRYVDDDFTGYM